MRHIKEGETTEKVQPDSQSQGQSLERLHGLTGRSIEKYYDDNKKDDRILRLRTIRERSIVGEQIERNSSRKLDCTKRTAHKYLISALFILTRFTRVGGWTGASFHQAKMCQRRKRKLNNTSWLIARFRLRVLFMLMMN